MSAQARTLADLFTVDAAPDLLCCRWCCVSFDPSAVDYRAVIHAAKCPVGITMIVAEWDDGPQTRAEIAALAATLDRLDARRPA